MHAATVSVSLYVSVVLCLESIISLVSSILTDSYNLSASCSAGFSEPKGRKFIGDSSFRIECSKTSLSVHCSFVCVCICSHILKMEASLMMADEDTNLCVQKNVIRSHYIAAIISQSSSIWFSPRSKADLPPGSWLPV